jgi:hypothetical protein
MEFGATILDEGVEDLVGNKTHRVRRRCESGAAMKMI